MGILGDPVVYWALRILTFLSLLLSGYLITYKDKDGTKFWRYSIPSAIIYSLNYGLRWDRSWDYPHYYQDLVGQLYTDYSDILYLAWIDIFKFSGFPFWVAFIFYSAILIYGFLLLVKRYPQTAVWALPLFFTFPTNVDNFVRQYFATAFLFFGFHLTQKKEYRKAVFFYLCCVTTHFSGVFAVFFLTLFSKINIQKHIKNVWVIIALFFGLYYLWDPSYMEGAENILKMLNFGESRAQDYINSASYWLTDASDINEKIGITASAGSLLYLLVTTSTYFTLIFFGFKLIKEKSEFSPFYFCMLLGTIINIMGGTMEIFSRFYCWLVWTEPIVIGAIFAYLPMRKTVRYGLIGLYIVNFYFYGFIWLMKNISLVGYQFIWDI